VASLSLVEVTIKIGQDRDGLDVPWYEDAAIKEGWIVLATDATIRLRADSTAWRFAILAAALQTIRHDWPQSAQ
jgi:hypothetical protein